MTSSETKMENTGNGEKPTGENSNFIQLNRSYMREMRGLARRSPVGMQILLYLTENMGIGTNAVICSYKTLQEITILSRTSVAKAIKVLKDDNWIDAIKIGNATAYCVNERAFWQSGKHQRKYAKFSATVIASESEQDSDYHEKAKQKLTYIPIIENSDILTIGSEKLSPPDQGDLDL